MQVHQENRVEGRFFNNSQQRETRETLRVGSKKLTDDSWIQKYENVCTGPTFFLITWTLSFFSNIIPIYIPQDATLHSLFYLETALRVSVGTTTYHQERKQLYLQHLVFVAPLRQIPDAVNTVVCAPDYGWWYHPKHVGQFPDKINCVTLHLVVYILEYWYTCIISRYWGGKVTVVFNRPSTFSLNTENVVFD